MMMQTEFHTHIQALVNSDCSIGQTLPPAAFALEEMFLQMRLENMRLEQALLRMWVQYHELAAQRRKDKRDEC